MMQQSSRTLRKLALGAGHLHRSRRVRPGIDPERSPYAAARFAQDFFQARAAMVAITVHGVEARTDSVTPARQQG